MPIVYNIPMVWNILGSHLPAIWRYLVILSCWEESYVWIRSCILLEIFLQNIKIGSFFGWIIMTSVHASPLPKNRYQDFSTPWTFKNKKWKTSREREAPSFLFQTDGWLSQGRPKRDLEETIPPPVAEAAAVARERHRRISGVSLR